MEHSRGDVEGGGFKISKHYATPHMYTSSKTAKNKTYNNIPLSSPVFSFLMFIKGNFSLTCADDIITTKGL